MLYAFGLGYTAGWLATGLLKDGWRVGGTVRTREKQSALLSAGLSPVDLFPVDDGGVSFASTLPKAATHFLISVPPQADGDPVLSQFADQLIQRAERIRWLGYLSTTGVYGDRGGAWVDEESDLRPSGPRQRRRVEAETGWLDLRRHHGLPVHVFRLAGIYGPGRSAIDSVLAGTARRIDKPGVVFGRIHVADIAAVLRASIDRPRSGAVYNLCDDEPAPGHIVIEHACRLLDLPPPPLVPHDQADLSPMAASFYADSRRVANRRIKDELGVRLKYPTYREGLAAILAARQAARL